MHDDSTIRDDFLAFLEERDYSLSYKMPFLLAFLERMDPATGAAPIDDVLDGYAAFYCDRLERGLPVDRPSCPYTLEFLSDHASVRRSMLANPFEKFERKRFMYHSRGLGEIALNHALLARMGETDWERVRYEAFEPLADHSTFKQSAIEHGVLTWDDGNTDRASERLSRRTFEYTPVKSY